MGKHNEMDLLKMAVEITASAVSGAGEKSAFNLNNPDKTASYLDAVFVKLKELNDSIS